MSVGEQGGVTVSKDRADPRRRTRRRWRILQNRIERARQLRQAAAGGTGKAGRPPDGPGEA